MPEDITSEPEELEISHEEPELPGLQLAEIWARKVKASDYTLRRWERLGLIVVRRLGRRVRRSRGDSEPDARRASGASRPPAEGQPCLSCIRTRSGCWPPSRPGPPYSPPSRAPARRGSRSSTRSGPRRTGCSWSVRRLRKERGWPKSRSGGLKRSPCCCAICYRRVTSRRRSGSS